VLTALAAGGGQIVGGLLFELGALIPLAAATAIGVMMVAVTVKWRNGFWVAGNGFKPPGYLQSLGGPRPHQARSMIGGPSVIGRGQ
jgi:putative oxidoreductase